MEIKTKQQVFNKQNEELGHIRTQLEDELRIQADKIEKTERTYQSKLNNVMTVKGQGFGDSKENAEIMIEVEKLKTSHLMNALA